MPHWIWYPGDFEIRHALKLNCRREQRDCQWPAYWKMDDCWKNVRVRKTAVLDAPDPASLSWMEGTVPVGGGSVKVSFRNGDLRVWTDRPGGALVWKGERIPLTPNAETVIKA